ncbi:MAG: cytochrome c biogenesis protein CcsA [Phycisphaerales bacterium]|nr:cytochrome c biogenesis protein CcsA [Phycisphaerales bacterium]
MCRCAAAWNGLLAALLLVCVADRALGQTAPAGNEHPRADTIAEVKGPNPFAVDGGEVKTMDANAKAEFAAGLRLDPLRDLAVFHDGRVKILDTLARETVSTITGKKKYFDYVLVEGKQTALRKRFDPMFTLMDMMVDPGYYRTRPLIGVDYLPLREAFLEKLFTDKGEIEWWKRDGRLKPADVERTWEAVVNENALKPGFGRALEKVEFEVRLAGNAWRSLLMVAPPSEAEPWAHLDTLPAEAPARTAMKDMIIAWRGADAAGVNAAAERLSKELPKINAGLYPTTKRSMERMYNSANAFEWGFWLYALALLMLLLAFGTSRRWLAVGGMALLFGGLGLHAFGFIARCIIAERFAIQNQFESMTGLSLFAVTVGTVIMLARRQWLFGAAAAGVGFMVLVTATQAGIPGMTVEREAPILNTSVLLKYHVTTVLLSYGLIALGFIVSLFYLVTHYAGRMRTGITGKVALAGGGAVGVSASALGMDEGAHRVGSARVLADLDKAQMIILQLAFWILGVGILLGAWWADHSWGRWWAFDPKELWALVTWIVYLIVIHLRFTTAGASRGLVTAWLSVVGFFVMLWTYFGVNLLLPGLHAYA